jgi:hypothetical protein
LCLTFHSHTGRTDELKGRFSGIRPKDDERSPQALKNQFMHWASIAVGLAIVDEV